MGFTLGWEKGKFIKNKKNFIKKSILHGKSTRFLKKICKKIKNLWFYMGF